MAIQFPPINPGDPEPQDGDTYLYFINQEEYVCRRSRPSEAAQWASIGLINTTSFGYRGTLNIQNPAPTDAEKGNIYSVADGGIADASFTGLAGTTVPQWSLIIFDDPNWILMNSAPASGPWLRTVGGRIQPTVSTDNLDMEQGNFLINELDPRP